MKRLALSLALVLCVSVIRAEDVELLLQLGLGDKEPSDWSGSVKVAPGELAGVSGWRFQQQDRLVGKDGWEARTRRQAVQGRANNPKKLGMAKRAAENLGPLTENGVFIKVRGVTDDSVITVSTKQGDFSFKVGDTKLGEPTDLFEGKAAAQRTAFNLRAMSQERTDDDYPALAFNKGGAGYLVYQSFTPGLDRDERAKKWDEEPADLSFLNKPAGGDQLWMHVREGNSWAKDRIAITEPGKDIYKSAVAIDGKGTAWIVWSERVDGAFAIMMRSFAGGKLSEITKFSNDWGNAVSPVATTDAEGKVWIAWQQANNSQFGIFARHQEGNAWSKINTVSSNRGNCWMPAIAASATGVAIAWDTYEKGDYDVWVREFANSGEAKDARPVANTALYEARPSLTYDKDGALWVAWEKSGQTWGKDWGAYDGQDGIGLYRDRQIGMAVLKDGQWMEPAGNVVDALPGAQPGKGKKKFRGADTTTPPPPVSPEQADGVNANAYLQPAARRGAPGEHAAATGWNTFNNIGRLGCDSDGRVWCIVRNRLNSFRGPVGSTWVSYAAYYDGDKWVGPILVPHSDNLIYSLPAVAAGPTNMFLAHATDHRMDRFNELPGGGGQGKGKGKAKASGGSNASLNADRDPFDNDVFFSRLQAQGNAKPAVQKPASGKDLIADAKPSKRTEAERAEVQAIRGYRIDLNGTKMQIVRGEFHRHTEISGDGAGDGPLEDMWRYALDAAAMDWLGNGDHDNGNGREYTWWLTQKTTDAFHLPGHFESMFSYERSVQYPEGHRNCVFAQRGVRTLPRLPISDRNDPKPSPDTLMLYKYLKQFGGVCASHTSVGTMGTDWRNWDPEVEPMVEVYQGARQNYEYAGCPRCPTENDAIGGWEPAGFLNNAFAKGYKFSFQSSSDHGSTHISYAMVVTDDYSREGILKAMKLRHTYGATDNIIADTQCTAADGKARMMGDEFSVKGAPTLRIKFVGTAPIAKVTIVKDNVEIPLEVKPGSREFTATWTDPTPSAGKTSYYYVRAEQDNSELCWASPMWITCE
ncbi:MAG: DUF3604 domain-containing protein [Verrucomicrobiaceae bacterium]|nr:DUF3604 domain-containing protein [Verrucomicrobiaceae bacterium]